MERVTWERPLVMGSGDTSNNYNPSPHTHTHTHIPTQPVNQSVVNSGQALKNSDTKSPPGYLASKNFAVPLSLSPLFSLIGRVSKKGRGGGETLGGKKRPEAFLLPQLQDSPLPQVWARGGKEMLLFFFNDIF